MDARTPTEAASDGGRRGVSDPDGYNPFRADCGPDGVACWLKTRKHRIERLARCLSGKAAFTDIDAALERNGWTLQIEFKDWTKPGEIPLGQRLMFEHSTAANPRLTVLLVCAPPSLETVRFVKMIRRGVSEKDWRPRDWPWLESWLGRWFAFADSRPLPPPAALKQIAGLLRADFPPGFLD